jgi:hypothetical protein
MRAHGTVERAERSPGRRPGADGGGGCRSPGSGAEPAGCAQARGPLCRQTANRARPAAAPTAALRLAQIGGHGDPAAADRPGQPGDGAEPEQRSADPCPGDSPHELARGGTARARRTRARVLVAHLCVPRNVGCAARTNAPVRTRAGDNCHPKLALLRQDEERPAITCPLGSVRAQPPGSGIPLCVLKLVSTGTAAMREHPGSILT